MARRTPPRRPPYKSPDEQLRYQDQRRADIMENAHQQSMESGADESAILEAMVIEEAVDRARGDPERALFIFDMESEMIQQDQTLDAIENLMNVVKEIATEISADPDYMTVMEEAECN